MLRKGDIILIACVIAIAAVLSVWRGSGGGETAGTSKIAVIRQGDKEIKRINLDMVHEPERITVSGSYECVVLIEKGRIRFEDANCPDRVCVKTGWLTAPGDTAVCLPNHVVVKIEGVNSDVDGVAY